MRAALLLTPILLLLIPLVGTVEEDVLILYPADRSVHRGPVQIIVAAPATARAVRATLNGKPLLLRRLPFDPEWVTPGAIEGTARILGDRQQRTLWVGSVSKPGRHVVSAGSAASVSFLLTRSPAPPHFAAAYTHPPLPVPPGRSACVACHSIVKGRLGAAATPQSCSPCHSEVAVQLVHRHVAQPLARCGMCHDPHGAPLGKLLVDAREKLCIRCHSAGHSKD